MAEYQSDAVSTKDTPYLALTGELWRVFCEWLWENWRRCNGINQPKNNLDLTHWCLQVVTPYADMATCNWVDSGSGDACVAWRHQPLPEMHNCHSANISMCLSNGLAPTRQTTKNKQTKTWYRSPAINVSPQIAMFCITEPSEVHTQGWFQACTKPIRAVVTK